MAGKSKSEDSVVVTPFKDYGEYMDHVFYVVNLALDSYLASMKIVYAARNGGYKNVLYPDQEIAGDVCKEKLEQFKLRSAAGGADAGAAPDVEQ